VLTKRGCGGPTEARHFHATAAPRGFDEFFQTGPVDSGAPWTVELLRQKSAEDLQKLWFVLMKEQNMLYTLLHECTTKKLEMEGSVRIKKVKKSMKRIKIVLGERESLAKKKVQADEILQIQEAREKAVENGEDPEKIQPDPRLRFDKKRAKAYPHPYPMNPVLLPHIG